MVWINDSAICTRALCVCVCVKFHFSVFDIVRVKNHLTVAWPCVYFLSKYAHVLWFCKMPLTFAKHIFWTVLFNPTRLRPFLNFKSNFSQVKSYALHYEMHTLTVWVKYKCSHLCNHWETLCCSLLNLENQWIPFLRNEWKEERKMLKASWNF